MRPRPATAALVKQNDTIVFRVEIAAHCWTASTTGPTMEHNNRHAVGVATLFNIDAMALSYVQHPLVIGVNGWMQIFHRGLLIAVFVHY
jgi:hypothetical protein